MQTFSNMRRNSIDFRALIPLALFFLAIIYQSLSSMYIYLSPLFGFCFYYMIVNFHKPDKLFQKVLIVIYILYFEIDKGFFIGSFILFFIISYGTFLIPLKNSIECKKCLIVLYVSFAYLGYFAFNLFLSFMFSLELPSISLLYLVYIISDIALVLLLL